MTCCAGSELLRFSRNQPICLSRIVLLLCDDTLFTDWMSELGGHVSITSGLGGSGSLHCSRLCALQNRRAARPLLSSRWRLGDLDSVAEK